jgi:hypothetical protein
MSHLTRVAAAGVRLGVTCAPSGHDADPPPPTRVRLAAAARP